MTKLPFLTVPLRSHLEVIDRAKEIGQAWGLPRVVVAAAEEDDILAALYACRKEGIADAVLVGNPDRVKLALEAAEVPEDTFPLIAAQNEETSARRAAELAGSGEADIVMKGFLKTSILLKTLLKHEYGLRDSEIVSHSAFMSSPSYGRLMNITDGGTLIAPTFEQKLTVIANGYTVLRAAGIERPKVAVLAPWDEVRSNVPETIMAADLMKVARKHWSAYLDIDGPMPFDLAVTDPSRLGVPSRDPVAGQADMLLAHTIEEANIIAKTLIQFCGAIFMGVISGARVPVSLVSRSDTMMNKMASIALAVCLADYQKRDSTTLPVFNI